MDARDWSSQVADAAHHGNRERLKELFAAAVDAWGKDEASRVWFIALSGSDAGAQTG